MGENMLKIEIGSENDRLTIATLLVKNGYTVRIGKETATGGKRAVYFVYAWKSEYEPKARKTVSKNTTDEEMDAVMSKLKQYTGEQTTLTRV